MLGNRGNKKLLSLIGAEYTEIDNKYKAEDGNLSPVIFITHTVYRISNGVYIVDNGDSSDVILEKRGKQFKIHTPSNIGYNKRGRVEVEIEVDKGNMIYTGYKMEFKRDKLVGVTQITNICGTGERIYTSLKSELIIHILEKLILIIIGIVIITGIWNIIN